MWSTPPNFLANDAGKNQVFSAFGHGQVLVDDVNHLLGLYMSFNVPFNTYSLQSDWGTVDTSGKWKRIYQGHIKKETDTFAYSFAVTADAGLNCEIRVYYDEAVVIRSVTAGTGLTIVSGTIDISAYTNGERYAVIIDGRALNGATPSETIGSTDIKPIALYEQESVSYSTLADFATDDTPTPAQWQLMSTQLGTAYSQSVTPRRPFIASERSGDTGAARIVWSGYVKHTHSFLAYQIEVESPYFLGTIDVDLNYNSVTLESFSLETTKEGKRKTATYTATYDLSGQGLTVGNEYYVEVTVDVDVVDWYDYCRVRYIYEQPSLQSAVSGWTEMVDFTPNQIVLGTADVAKVRDNIEWITDRVEYRNYAVHDLMSDNMSYYYFWRLHPWLLYLCEDADTDATPKLEMWTGEWEEVTLKSKPSEWLIFDLASGPVRPGGMYRLKGVKCAIEVASA